jgi:hypothetical protein
MLKNLGIITRKDIETDKYLWKKAIFISTRRKAHIAGGKIVKNME